MPDSGAWGKQKTNYYNTDYAEDDDKNASDSGAAVRRLCRLSSLSVRTTTEGADALAEEAEANRLEARKAAAMTAQDFGADTDADADADRPLALRVDAARQPASSRCASDARARRRRLMRAARSVADELLLRELNQSLTDVAFASSVGGAGAQQIAVRAAAARSTHTRSLTALRAARRGRNERRRQAGLSRTRRARADSGRPSRRAADARSPTDERDRHGRAAVGRRARDD